MSAVAPLAVETQAPASDHPADALAARIEAAVADTYRRRPPWTRHRSTRPTEIGFQCDRRLVYCQTLDPPRQPTPDQRARMDVGTALERHHIVPLLRDAGLTLLADDPIYATVEDRRLGISGRIDFFVSHNGAAVPLEAKTMAPHVWERTLTLADVTGSRFQMYGGRGWQRFGDKAYPEGWLAAKFMGAASIRLRNLRRERVVPAEPTECESCEGRGARDYHGQERECRRCMGRGQRRVSFWQVTAEAFRVGQDGREEPLGEFTGRHEEADYTPTSVDASAAAEQNLKSRLVRDLFDIGDLSWADLAKLGVRGGGGDEKFQGGSRGGQRRGGATAGAGDPVPKDSPLWKALWGKLSALGYAKDAVGAYRARLEKEGITVAGLRKKLDEIQKELDGKKDGGA